MTATTLMYPFSVQGSCQEQPRSGAGPAPPRRSRIRVLNVLHDERFGGPQSRVLQVATKLRELDVETTVVIPSGGSAFREKLSDSSLRAYEIHLVRLRESLDPRVHGSYLRRFWPNVRELRRILRREQVDVVHANGLIHLQAPLAAYLEEVPLVWHLNDVGTPLLLRSALLPLLEQWSTVIAVSAKGVATHYFGNASDRRCIVLYPPVDSARFHPGIDGSTVRREFNIAPTAPLIGTVGNLNPDKGLHHLLAAGPAIKARFPTAKIMIVGDRLKTRQRYAHQLVELARRSGIASDVIFTGHRSDVPEILAAMSIYIHPARVEAIGMATMEASAVGLPVVATAVGGVAEVVEDGVTGLLIEPESPLEISNAVTSLLNNPHRARSMGLHGSQRVHHTFSVEACAAAHLRAYQTALAFGVRRTKTTRVPTQTEPDLRR